MISPEDIEKITLTIGSFTKVVGALELTVRELTGQLKDTTAALEAARASAPQLRGDDGGGTAYSNERRTPSDAPPPRQTFTGAWQEFTIPFGKQAGRTLGSLPSGSLRWWIENYQPKPYNGNPPRPSDYAFRAALDAAKADNAGEPRPAAPQRQNDLPLEEQNNLVNRDGTSAGDEDVPF